MLTRNQYLNHHLNTNSDGTFINPAENSDYNQHYHHQLGGGGERGGETNNSGASVPSYLSGPKVCRNPYPISRNKSGYDESEPPGHLKNNNGNASSGNNNDFDDTMSNHEDHDSSVKDLSPQMAHNSKRIHKSTAYQNGNNNNNYVDNCEMVDKSKLHSFDYLNNNNNNNSNNNSNPCGNMIRARHFDEIQANEDPSSLMENGHRDYHRGSENRQQTNSEEQTRLNNDDSTALSAEITLRTYPSSEDLNQQTNSSEQGEKITSGSDDEGEELIANFMKMIVDVIHCQIT